MNIITVSETHMAFVDPEYLEMLSEFHWSVQEKPSGLKYAVIYCGRQQLSMHRLLMMAGHGEIIDHKNGDGMDNRLENLRFCSHKQNMANQKPSKGRAFKGVYSYNTKNRGKRWYVIAFGKYRGSFASEVEASERYNEAAVLEAGEFARKNFVS